MFRVVAVLFLILTVFTFSACVGTLKLSGNSMYPTINDGDKVRVDKDAFNNMDPMRTDIVLYEYEGGKRISRIIGLPMETITIEDGAVYVNGNKLDEPYLAPGTRTESDNVEYNVPKDSYLLLSDNREKSSDSRQIGFISREDVLAKVLK